MYCTLGPNNKCYSYSDKSDKSDINDLKSKINTVLNDIKELKECNNLINNNSINNPKLNNTSIESLREKIPSEFLEIKREIKKDEKLKNDDKEENKEKEVKEEKENKKEIASLKKDIEEMKFRMKEYEYLISIKGNIQDYMKQQFEWIKPYFIGFASAMIFIKWNVTKW